MSRNPKKVSTIGTLALAMVVLNTIILRNAATGNSEWYEALVLTVPLMGLALVQLARARRSLTGYYRQCKTQNSMPADMVVWIIVLVSMAASLLFLFRYLKKQKRRKAALLTTISQLGSHNDLSFTGQEVLGQSVIGIDGLKKKLLVLENRGSVYRWYTINLEEVSSCSVQKTYRVASGAPVSYPAISGYVDRVELLFHCRGKDHPMAVPFYSAGRNEAAELPALEARARSWQCFLTKLLPAQQAGRA